MNKFFVLSLVFFATVSIGQKIPKKLTNNVGLNDRRIVLKDIFHEALVDHIKAVYGCIEIDIYEDGYKQTDLSLTGGLRFAKLGKINDERAYLEIEDKRYNLNKKNKKRATETRTEFYNSVITTRVQSKFSGNYLKMANVYKDILCNKEPDSFELGRKYSEMKAELFDRLQEVIDEEDQE